MIVGQLPWFGEVYKAGGVKISTKGINKVLDIQIGCQ